MKISIIVPVFNKEPYIRQCIQSLVQQTHKDIEILVFDDGSSDGSMDVVKSFQDPRIALFGDGKNHGVSYARNRLIEAATSKIVALQDADDFSHPDRIRIQYEAMQMFKNPRIRCTKVSNADFGIAEKNWFSGKEPSAGHPKGIKRTSGTFSSEMFVKKPLVPFRENLRFREEVIWVSDMRVIWGGAINLKKKLYAKRLVWDETSMAYWWLDAKNQDERTKAARVYRSRTKNRPPYFYDACPEAEKVKAQVQSGEFFK